MTVTIFHIDDFGTDSGRRLLAKPRLLVSRVAVVAQRVFIRSKKKYKSSDLLSVKHNGAFTNKRQPRHSKTFEK